MVSDSELIDRLKDFLRNADLDNTTNATVRRQLETDFGIDLSDRKSFIRNQIELFFQEYQQPKNDESSQPEDSKKNTEEEESDSNKNTEEEEGEDDDNEEEEEEKPKRAKSLKKKKGGSNKLDDEVVKKKGGGFCKLCSLSPQLQEFVGAPEMARTEVVRQLWVYIKEKNLQDPDNRRNIICDEPLRGLFGVNSINMFQMNKALTKHIWPLDSDDVVQVKSAPKEKKQKKQEREDDPDEPERKEKRQKGGKSGFLAPLQLSDALVNFLGTGENELSRSEVVKRMWDYIKGNNLQDPSDKRKVLCDDKLKELFGLDTFVGFTVLKLLTPHLKKTEQ